MAKTVSWILGVILAVAGIWGFFGPGFGFIAGNTLAAIIHLVLGIILIVLASKPAAVTMLKTVGIIYVILGLLGLLSVGFLAADGTTNWFYLIVGVIVAIIGFAGKKGGASSAPAPQA